MSYPDPLSLTPVASFTAGSALSFNRLREGQYMLSTTTIDQPGLLSLQSTIKPSGVSSFVAKYSFSKNVAGTPPYGTDPIPDDVGSFHVVARLPHRSFSNADMATFRDLVCGFVLTGAHWDRFLRGEL